MATVSIRMDDSTKTAFEGFCDSIGLTVSAFFNMTAKVALRENRIPFEVKADPFWSEENQEWLKMSLQQAKEGKLTKHEISEVM
mgnify:FL=1